MRTELNNIPRVNHRLSHNQRTEDQEVILNFSQIFEVKISKGGVRLPGASFKDRVDWD